jgi:hypothetical protein
MSSPSPLSPRRTILDMIRQKHDDALLFKAAQIELDAFVENKDRDMGGGEIGIRHSRDGFPMMLHTDQRGRHIYCAIDRSLRCRPFLRSSNRADGKGPQLRLDVIQWALSRTEGTGEGDLEAWRVFWRIVLWEMQMAAERQQQTRRRKP